MKFLTEIWVIDMQTIFTEENGKYKMDFSKAVDTIVDLNKKYQCIGNFLSDVDFIAETSEKVFLIEYKNVEIENATNPGAFYGKIHNGELYDSIIKKYYDSMFYILACKKHKTINYIFILECKKADSIIRKKMKASIKKRLPYILQENEEIRLNLISDFDILSINEWNNHIEYSKFPLFKAYDINLK
jgi:hypothetical protein